MKVLPSGFPHINMILFVKVKYQSILEMSLNDIGSDT